MCSTVQSVRVQTVVAVAVVHHAVKYGRFFFSSLLLPAPFCFISPPTKMTNKLLLNSFAFHIRIFRWIRSFYMHDTSRVSIKFEHIESRSPNKLPTLFQMCQINNLDYFFFGHFVIDADGENRTNCVSHTQRERKKCHLHSIVRPEWRVERLTHQR